MESKLITDQAEKTFVLVFETGDEVVDKLLEFAKQQQLAAARFTAIGAFQELTLGYFDWQKKEYLKIPMKEQVEVLSLAGNVVSTDKGPKLHAHIVDHCTHTLSMRFQPLLLVPCCCC